MSALSGKNDLLAWCASVIGPVEVVDSGIRGMARPTHMACRLRAEFGDCYLKTHRAPQFWHSEVYAYRNWAGVFGDRAPRLLAVRDTEPRAILVTALDGECPQNLPLSIESQRDIWRVAGEALRSLHESAVGAFFGACRCDGTCMESAVRDPEEFLSSEFDELLAQAIDGGYLTGRERSVVTRARELVSSFTGEVPVPCHRDYHPVNWLVNPEGAWQGIVDFEFCRWDLRLSDFARYPDWEWERCPELPLVLLEGYGGQLSEIEETQLLALRARYALNAIVYGHRASMFGFEEEGREALKHLSELL